ncbi:MAG: metallophosphoesterase [Candidatus Methanofastidiosia archaeon]|jgi:serine/threonine-protein phosphatase PP1 catalytic subunit
MISPQRIVENPETVFDLIPEDILDILKKVRQHVEKEKNMISIKGDTIVVGDLHGDFEAAVSIFDIWKGLKSDFLVFLGDYVDRGEHQLETINFLLALKCVYPDKVFLLRGNHETPSVNSYYGFKSVCAKTFDDESKSMYDEYNDLFSYFSPVCLCGKIFLVHGGIPQELDTLEDLNALEKEDSNAKQDILGQLLWNDPSEHYNGFQINWTRGIHYTYGKKVFLEFLEQHDLDMVIRAHEVFLEGYKYFFDQKLLCIFSSPHYKKGNKAKIAHITGEKVELIPII